MKIVQSQFMNRENQKIINSVGMKVLKKREIISLLKNSKKLHLSKISKNLKIKKFKLNCKIRKIFQILMGIKDKSYVKILVR